MIVIDVEIKKAILGRNEMPVEGVEYCEGWRDFKGMGVACACTYDLDTSLSQVFLGSEMPALQALIDDHGGEVAGFNTRRFDLPLLAEHGVKPATSATHYDALERIWLKLGLDPDKFVPQTHGGWGLDAVMLATFGLQKSGNGAMAPVWWQQGQRGRVVSYCLRDVWLEAKLIRHMMMGIPIRAAGKPDVVVAAVNGK